MELNKKMELLEEVMDLEAGELEADAVLADMDCWDSMTKLSLIVMMEDQFGKKLANEEIRGFKVVQDILDIME